MQHPARLKSVAMLASLAVVGLFLAWRIVVVNMADHYAQDENPALAAQALEWDPRHPGALYTLGASLATTDPQKARAYLEDAIRHNPTEGRAYAVLARIHEAAGDLPRAERAMAAAATLSPRRTDVQAEVAGFWMRRGDVARAMPHWNVVLTWRRELWPQLFPAMLQLAENPQTRNAFAPLLAQEVNWWPHFFAHAAAKAADLDTVRALHAMQSSGPNEATAVALKAYLERLQREGYWTEAYLVWLNQLRPEQLGNVGNLYNGGFEEPLTNMGFDWVSQRAGQVLVETASTYGTTGARALHVVFRGPRVRYRHLGQYLLLPPGQYTFRGRARPDSLETTGGVQWVVQCFGQEAPPLAASERFAGTDQWRHFSFLFTIPDENCPVQLVRLELTGRANLDFDAKGGIWFDDLAVERALD